MTENIDQASALPTFSKLRSWLIATRQQTQGRQPTELEMDTDLISEGVLDSLEMVNFIMYIEDIRGQEIPEALMQPEYFTSLKVICDTFFRD